MKKTLAAAGLLAGVMVVIAGCASSQNDDGPMPPPPAAASDERLSELQTSLTELLERLDVMNDRLTKLEQSGSAAGAGTVPARPPAPPQSTQTTHRSLAGAELQDAYRNALVLYGKGKFEEARRAFQAVLDAEPAGQLADNALYWIGETYFAANDFTNAMRYYKRVTTEFGDENKAPDALFKIALAYEKTSDLALARQTLEEVIRRYPYSTSAASAKAELKRIKY